MKACIIKFISKRGEVKYPTEGILFERNGKDYFIVTNLLYSEKTYIGTNRGKREVKAGYIFRFQKELEKYDIEETTIEPEKFKYWKQYLKLKDDL
jgi:hypothetical protein